MARIDIPGMIVTTTARPERNPDGSITLDVHARMRRGTLARMRACIWLMRLAGKVAPPLARKVIADKLGA